MGDLRFQSVAQRRRAGVSSYPGSWSPPTAPVPLMRDIMSEAVAGMAKTGNPRQPMDRSELASLVNRSAEGAHGISRPRFAQPASDPAFFPVARPAPVLQEKAGARYGIRVPVPIMTLPEAGATQANGRLIRGRGVLQNFAGV